MLWGEPAPLSGRLAAHFQKQLICLFADVEQFFHGLLFLMPTGSRLRGFEEGEFGLIVFAHEGHGLTLELLLVAELFGMGGADEISIGLIQRGARATGFLIGEIKLDGGRKVDLFFAVLIAPGVDRADIIAGEGGETLPVAFDLARDFRERTCDGEGGPCAWSLECPRAARSEGCSLARTV